MNQEGDQTPADEPASPPESRQGQTAARDGAHEEAPGGAEGAVDGLETVEAASWPRPWMGPFLASLARLGNVSGAARSAGISRPQVYTQRDMNDRFAKAWEAALEEAVDLLEQEAWRRATVGATRRERKRALNDQGVLVVVEERELEHTSDHLLQFLLQAHRPDKFRPKQRIEQTGAGGGPIEVEVTEHKIEEARGRLRAEVLRLAGADGARSGAPRGG